MHYLFLILNVLIWLKTLLLFTKAFEKKKGGGKKSYFKHQYL